MAKLLEATNVTKVFGGGIFNKKRTVAVEDISLHMDADHPSITAIAGESGSGKTTLARLLLGIYEPTSGELRYAGKNISRMSREEKKRFRREVQAIFQDPFEVYNPFYKIDHVLYTPISKFKLAKSKSDATNRIEQALSAVGLRPEETLGRYAHELSAPLGRD